MLTAEQIAAYRDAAAMLVDPVNDYIIRDVARRVAKAGQLTSTAAYQVYRMQLMGKTKKEIMARLKKEMGVSEREAEKLLTQAAETGYRYDIQWLPDAKVLPFARNGPFQQIVSAAVKLAQDDFRNLTQTLGMVSRTGKALPLQEAYLEAVDDVFKRVITGAADYNTATRQACQTLYDRGLVVIDYESGVRTSLEAAVRRDMMGGLGLMQEQISAELHDQAGSGRAGISKKSWSWPTVNCTWRIFSEKTSSLAREPTMEMDSITASAAWGPVRMPRLARARAVGSVPMRVEGKSAKLSFMVTKVEVSHLTTKVRKSVMAPAYFS